jgi:polyhydroxyalkanoate synthesis regulator phasin
MGLGDLVQKAVYLGIGVASYAGEKASATLGTTLNDIQGDLQGQIDKLGGLQEQLQKMADEMVARGEMTAEDSRRFVDDMIKKAQETPGQPAADAPPRKIEIVDEPEAGAAPPTATAPPTAPPTANAAEPTPSSVDDIDIDTMRRQVMELQDELRRLRRP